METKNQGIGIESGTQEAGLPETTFGATEVGRTYLTVKGHKVRIAEVVSGSHAIVETAKGRQIKVPADSPCSGPLPEEGDAQPATIEQGAAAEQSAVPAGEAPVADEPSAATDGQPATEAAPATAPKRQRDKTIDDLRAEYEAVVGRPTGSTDRRYLLWKIGEAQKGRVPVGPVQRRAGHATGDVQVLPLGMARDTVAKLDGAVKAMGYKSRMAFIRDALAAKLTFEGSQAGADPVIAEAATAIEAEAN